MGSASSSLSDLSNNLHLKKFVSQQVFSPCDPFWNQFLSFSVNLPNDSSDYRLLEESVELPFKSLLENNEKTGNIGALIQVFLSRATELKASAHLDNSLFIWQTHNALFLIHCITKLLLENVPEVEMISIHQTNQPSLGKKEDLSHLVETLLATLIEVIVDVPLTDSTYALHVEASNTLLVFMSSHIFIAGVAPRHIVIRTLMSGKPAIHACLLVKTLLKRFMAQTPPPVSKAGGSIILGLASGLWNVLTLGLSTIEEEAEQHNKNKTTMMLLASQSLLLLLVLTNHYTTHAHKHNPYREALLNSQNFQDPIGNVPKKATVTFKVEFSTLFDALHTHLSCDQATLLLYLLLHKNADFRNYVLSRTDIETLVLPILRTLYNAADSTSHHIYMSLIILLILSEDDTFNTSVHDVTLKDIAWYTERPIHQISLGGLLILVVIRTITFNMTKMRDKYLHTNCLAAIANMSCQFRSLHPYVCQRIVSLFETLTKKHNRLCESLRQNGHLLDATEHDISDVMSDVSVLEEVLRMVLEILNSTLTHQLSHNHNLVYTLLYKRHLFDLFHTHPNFQDVTHNIEMVLQFLMDKMESSTSDPSVEGVQKIIEEGVLHFPRDRLHKFPELKFKYVEESEPEEFFIPYVWTLVYHSAGLYWKPHAISLFDAAHFEQR